MNICKVRKGLKGSCRLRQAYRSWDIKAAAATRRAPASVVRQAFNSFHWGLSRRSDPVRSNLDGYIRAQLL